MSPYSNGEKLTPVFYSGRSIKSKDIEQAHICIGYPGLPLRDDRLHDLILLDSIVGGTMSSRMFQKIREEKGLHIPYSPIIRRICLQVHLSSTGEQVLNIWNEMVTTMDQLIDDVVADGVRRRKWLMRRNN